MPIKVVNPFKSQTTRTFDKSEIGQEVHAGERFPSAGVSLHSGKKIFKFGTTATVMDDNLSKQKPLEHMSSSLFNVCADIRVEKQKRILSKIKSVKSNITKLLNPTGRVSAVVPSVDSFAIPGVGHSTTNDRSLLPSILQHAKPKAHVTIACKSTLPPYTSLEAIASHVPYGESVVNECIEDLSATFLVDASSPSSTGQLSTMPVSQLDTFPSTFSPSGLQTIEEEDGGTEFVVGAVNAEQREAAMSGSSISWSNSDSGVTVYLSSDTLSDHTTARGIGLVSSETSASPADTSFATSIGAGDSHQFLPDAHHGLRRVPSYEDLRAIADRDLSCSDISCEASGCDSSYGTASGINAAPLRRLRECDNLRKSFLLLEPEICTPSTRQMNKYRKFRAWLRARGHESSRNIQMTSTSQAPSEPLKATPVSRSPQFLQSILYPSRRVRAHVFKLSPDQPSPPSSPPVWSCAKITRSSLKAKRRQRMTKESMKRLRARLDSMDIDPWC